MAGALNAAMDISFSHYDRSVFSRFGHDGYFNPQLSWPHKWAVDAEGHVLHGVDRFWESSRLLVAFTDFWHLAKSLMLIFIMLAVLSYRRQQTSVKERLVDIILCYAAFTGTFTIFYDCILAI